MWWRKQRVRVHLIDSHPAVSLPSVEGVLIAKRSRELVLGVPRLIVSTEGNPAELESRYLVIPRERVAFWEILG
jgi:hypothetical protein